MLMFCTFECSCGEKDYRKKLFKDNNQNQAKLTVETSMIPNVRKIFITDFYQWNC